VGTGYKILFIEKCGRAYNLPGEGHGGNVIRGFFMG
jgi:hypothetical protein